MSGIAHKWSSVGRSFHLEMETSSKRSEAKSSRLTEESKRPDRSQTRKSKTSRKETVSAVVRRDSLRGNVNPGLRYHRFFSRGLQRIPIVAHKRVEVEANKLCRSSSICYSPEKTGMTLCEIEKVRPDAKNVVRSTDDFVISFVGMSIASHDAVTGLSRHKSDNELLLYSVKSAMKSPPSASISENPITENGLEAPKKNIEQQKTEVALEEDPTSSAKRLENAEELKVPTSFDTTDDSVFIHYDPVIDAHNTGTLADTFVKIPASKKAYACSTEFFTDHNGTDEKDDPFCLRKVPVKFTVMEIDKISDMQARAVIGVDHVGSFMSEKAGSVPYIALLTKAFAVGSAIGKQGLKSYSRPDHVLSADVEFCLAKAPSDGSNEDDEKDKDTEVKRENYLRVS